MFNLFPQDPAPPLESVDWKSENGMELRDYFAAKAMQTLLGSEYTSNHGLHEGRMNTLAHEAYMMSDAMLKARKSNE
jgi:hypothetical protein